MPLEIFRLRVYLPSRAFSRYTIRVLVFISAAVCFLVPPINAGPKNGPLTRITLQLKWYHQFQFAGFYAAKEKGFYKDAGLSVDIREGGPGIEVQDILLSGKADVGVLGSELVCLRADGLKIVMLAPIIQHSVRTIIARKDRNIVSPHDLIGKKIMLNSNELAEFQAMFLSEGVRFDTLTVLHKNTAANDLFIAGDIDAINGSLANQPYLFEKRDVPFNLIRPINYGIDFYGDTLFTTEDNVKNNPEIISLFMRASFKGWHYAFDHPDELIDVIIEKYNSKKIREQLNFEQSRLRSLVQPDLVEIGHNNPARWSHIQNTYQKLGMVREDFSLKGFFYDDYNLVESKWILRLIVILGFAVIFSAGIALYNFQLRKNVRKITREIQEDREYFKITMSSIGDAVISIDLSGNIVTMNPVAEKLTGWSLHDARGMELKKAFNIVNSKTREPAENPVNKVLKNGKIVGLANHTALIAKDGTEYQIADSGAPIRDAKGNIIGVVMVFRDVTEEYLHLQQIMNLGKFPSENPHPIMRVTPDGILRYANKGSLPLLDVWGCRAGEPIPENWSRKVLQAMSSGQTAQYEAAYPGGFFSLVITPVKEMNYANIYGMDITEQKEHFERFKTIMDSLESLVYVSDINTYEILFMNKYGLETWGDVKGKKCWQALQENQDGPCAFCTNARLLAANSDVPVIREFQNSANNQWYEGRAQIIRWIDGRMVRMEIASDITHRKREEQERKTIEEKLRHSHKLEAIGTIAGGIAHDFNNILGIIIGNAELALDDVPDWNPARTNLKEIKTAGMRAREVVRQLLNFSRKSEESKKIINIREILVETINLLRASIPTSIEIRTEFSGQRESILADPTQIHQVLINLCTNAAHAMEDRGGVLSVVMSEIELDELTISQYQEINPGRYVQLNISDTGCGIDPAIKDKIFDPYFTTKDIGKGTGMGLAVVLGIIKNHNGAITVYSEPGRGTTFRVLLPLAENEGKTTPHVPEYLPEGAETILFVDDEAAIADMGSEILRRLGYHVYTETNPLKALEFLKANPSTVDLVITDMTMPQLTGDLLAKEVLNVNPELSIILCTGFSSKIDNEKAIEMGISRYIEKPLNKFELATVVKDVLAQHKHNLTSGSVLNNDNQ